MTRRRLPDVAFVRPVDRGFGFRCDRCGVELVVAVPVPVPELVGVTRDFIRRHEPCARAAAADLEGKP